MTTPERVWNGELPGPLPDQLLDDPLEYLLADHLRQRGALAALRAFAAARSVPVDAAEALRAHLAIDVPLHHADEEEDLLPTLAKRLLPEDDLDGVLARLAEDHRRSAATLPTILKALGGPARENAIALDAATRRAIKAYAESEHHHLAIENAVVLAIAGVRLSRKDLDQISRGMRARRESGLP